MSDVLYGRLFCIETMGAELARWLDLRESFLLGARPMRCFRDAAEGMRSAIEKERRCRDVASCAAAREATRDCDASRWEVAAALMLRGVLGRLTKKTLFPSSLTDSSVSSVPTATDRASTSMG